MKRSLCDECIVVIGAEDPCALEGPDDRRDRTKLRPALRDALFVHGERLYVVLIRPLLEATLVGYLSGKEI